MSGRGSIILEAIGWLVFGVLAMWLIMMMAEVALS